MGKVPYLFRRAGNWTFRRRVPGHLVGAIEKTQIWKSLGAVSFKQARREARKLAVETDALFDAKERLLRGAVPTVDELREIVRAHFVEGQKIAVLAHVRESGPEKDEVLAAISEDQHLVLQSAEDPALQRVAKFLIDSRKLNVPPGSEERRVLLDFIQRAEIERLERLAARVNGDGRETAIDPIFAGLSSASALSEASRRPVTVGRLIDLYLADPGRDRSRKTLDGYKVIFRALRELLSEKIPARDVSRDDCRRIRNVLMKLPPNATKRFKGLSLEKVAAKAEKEGLSPISPKTATSYLQNLSALFGWAVQEGYADSNPAQGLKVADAAGRRGKKSRKRPFDDEQLKAIFAAPLYTGCRNDQSGYATPGDSRPRRGRYWVPLLSLFHGLRLNEACQLHVDDVTTRDGVPVILIRAGDNDGEDTEKRVKTEAGERFVPVHPEVVALGFLQHVDAQRKRGEERIFPDLKIGANGYYSDPFSKWFARFLAKAGAAKPNTSFHSFRHRYRDALREADISMQRAMALGGWTEGGGTAALYGEGLRPSTLAEEIAKVRFDALDLRHLAEAPCTD